MTKELKKAYGLENLYFYVNYQNRMFHCKYSSVEIEEKIDFFDLDYLLKALAIQQAHVFFDDVSKECIGIDELKEQYLLFVLSGL